jgi:hypothetical protein
MKVLKCIFVITTVLFSSFSFSQDIKFRFASASDLEGYWSVMLLKRFDADNLPTNRQMFGNDPCNVHIIKGDGKYINISSQVGDPTNPGKLTCATKIDQVERSMQPLKASAISWSTLQAAGQQAPGVFFTKAPSDSRHLTWQVGYVNENIEDQTTTMNYGFELKQGDLVFNLLEKRSRPADQNGKSEFRIVWFMVLRRIAE